ncbi:cutinase, partial [Mycobacterium sp. ITM-2017-0098]
NPLSADRQMSYNDSRAEGTRAAVTAMTDMNNRCPLTSYVLVGVSQGAVIAGDLASDIGNGRGPVDQDLVLGAMLIADGRRQAGVG